MKIKKFLMGTIAAAAMLAVCPTVHAQTDTNSSATTPRAPRSRGGPTLESIDKAVTLTDDQKPKVKSALEQLSTAMAAARNADQDDRRTKMQSAREDFDKQMKSILTPDQYTKFQAMPRPGGRRNGGGGGGGGGGTTGGGGNSPSGN
jgi:Spy/CpxP family protein refolding chaperone